MCLYSPTKGIVAVSFARLCRDICRASRTQDTAVSIAPKVFKKAVSACAPHLLDYNQQDCHEFLRFLLNGMSDDLCRSAYANKPAMPAKAKPTPPPATEPATEEEPETGDEGASEPSSPLKVTTAAGAGAGAGTSPSMVDKVRSQVADAGAAMEIAAMSIETDTEEPSAGSAAEGEPASAPEGGSSSQTRSAKSHSQTKTKTKTPEEEAAEAWQGYLKMNESIITDIFGGQLQSCIECQHCKHISRTFDPFMDLCVEIPRSDSKSMLAKTLSFTDSAKCTLAACLNKFMGEEVLEGENMWRCDKCKQPRKAVKRLSLYKLPKVLVISLKRFRWGASSRDKVTADVNFPIDEPLDVRPFLAQERPSAAGDNCLYDIVGVANHIGGTGFGHYIAHCNVNSNSDSSTSSDSAGGAVAAAKMGPQSNPHKASQPAKWMCFNDGKVSKTKNSAAIGGPSAYLLFYQLRDT